MDHNAASVCRAARAVAPGTLAGVRSLLLGVTHAIESA